MSFNQFANNPLTNAIEDIRSSWGWFLALGVLFVLLGTVCVIGSVSATFATVIVFGWMLIISGVFGLVNAFGTRTWQGFLLTLLSALARGFAGYVLIRYPLGGAISLTVILASFLIVCGLFRAIGAGALQFPHWGWSVFSGVVSLVLGIMLLAQLPVSSVWFIGFAIGVDLICDGSSLIGFAAAIHRLPGFAVRKTA